MKRSESKEVIVVDKKTGGQKGQKLQRFSLIPPDVEWLLAEHYGRGALKYADRNWEKGYNWSLSYDALKRHLNQRLRGEVIDQETGSRHLIAVVWHAMALAAFELRGAGTDDLTMTVPTFKPVVAPPLSPRQRHARRAAKRRKQ